MTEGPPTSDPIGTVAEEAAKLIALLGRRTAEPSSADPGRGQAGDSSAAGHAAYASSSPADDTCREHPRAGEALTCALCPICHGIAVLRTLNPEIVDRLADLATAASAALRELAASTASAAQATPGDGARRGNPRGDRGPDHGGRARTVDIEVVDDEEQHS
ncbi:MAG: hypothetical protein ABI131_08150 [Nostocoides sp.]